jgi:hypothetical protein
MAALPPMTEALAEGRDALEQALARNVYPGGAPDAGLAAALASHVIALRDDLAAQSADDILKGRITFREPLP